MKVNTYNINPKQINKVNQIAQQSAMNASDSLTKLINKQVSVKTLTTKILSPTELSAEHGEPEDIFTIVVLKVSNGINATLIFCLPINQAEELVSIMLQKNNQPKHKLTEIEESALKEVGNVLAGSFLLEMSKTTGHKLVQSIPGIATDMIKAILDELSSEIALTSKNSLAISINIEIQPITIKGCMTLILDANSTQQILTSLEKQT